VRTLKNILYEMASMKICEACVWDYIKRLIELEKYMPTWNECKTDELLFVIGEPETQENIVNMNIARERL